MNLPTVRFFYKPTLDSFCTSDDYLINKNCYIGYLFSSIYYDRGLVTSVILNGNNGPSKFDIDESVFV